MQRVLVFASAVVALGVSSLGCGSAAPVDFFDPSPPSVGVAGASNAGGAPATAGAASASAGSADASSAGSADASSAGSADASSAGTGSSGSSTVEPCSPVTMGTNMASGDFQTTGPVCLKVTDPVVGWGCSNFEGRTIKVNGATLTCGQVPLPEKLNDAYYFDISAGDFGYASFYWWSA